MNVREVMSKNVIKVSSVTMLPEVAQKMADENIGAMPVEEGDRLVGIVTDRDIAVRAVARRSVDVPVSDVMTRNPITICPTATIEDAIRLMLKNHVRRLAVMENDHLVGVLSLEDLLDGDKEPYLVSALKKLHTETKHE